MIQEILLTTLICLGLTTMGTENNSVSIFQNQDTTIKANTKNQITQEDGVYTYNYQFKYNDVNSANLNWQNNILAPEGSILHGHKFTATISNEIMTADFDFYESYVYSQNEAITQIYNEGAWIHIEEQNGLTATAAMQTIQITPYRFTYENKLNVTYTTLINNNFGQNTKLEKITIITSENWSQYIDITTYNTPYYINNLYKILTNPSIGYQYTEKKEIISFENIEDNETYKTYIDTTNIELIGEKTNYVFIFYLLTNSVNNITTPKINDFFTTNKYYIVNLPKLNTITGSFIPPIDNYEVVDIPNLIFTILTLPFSFISQAFNLTLFPGTQYQINLSNLFLAFIGILIFVFILKIFLGLKG